MLKMNSFNYFKKPQLRNERKTGHYESLKVELWEQKLWLWIRLGFF